MGKEQEMSGSVSALDASDSSEGSHLFVLQKREGVLRGPCQSGVEGKNSSLHGINSF